MKNYTKLAVLYVGMALFVFCATLRSDITRQYRSVPLSEKYLAKTKRPRLETSARAYEYKLYRTKRDAKGRPVRENFYLQQYRVAKLKGEMGGTFRKMNAVEWQEACMDLALLESGGNPKAFNEESNAAGLWQQLKSTAKIHCLKTASLDATKIRKKPLFALMATDERFDQDKAAAVTVKILRDEYARFKDASKAMAAYHMGAGNMAGILAAYEKETGKKISRWYEIYYVLGDTTLAPDARERLERLGDDSKGYYAKLLVARHSRLLYENYRDEFDRRFEYYNAEEFVPGASPAYDEK